MVGMENKGKNVNLKKELKKRLLKMCKLPYITVSVFVYK